MKVASVKSVSMRRQPEGEGIALETSQDFPNTERETSLELANLVVGNHALYQLSYSRMPFSFYRARDFRPAEVAGRHCREQIESNVGRRSALGDDISRMFHRHFDTNSR